MLNQYDEDALERWISLYILRKRIWWSAG